jgi:hypothetical protein
MCTLGGSVSGGRTSGLDRVAGGPGSLVLPGITSVTPGGQRASTELSWLAAALLRAWMPCRIWTGRWHRPYDPGAGKEHQRAIHRVLVRSVRVDGVTYDHDLIIDRGKIRKRKKAASKRFRGAYGHTPLSIAEDIPWRCRRLVIGTAPMARCR